MIALLLVWGLLLVVLIAFGIGGRKNGGALTLAYFLGLSLIHVPGVIAFLGNAPGLAGWHNTLSGFQLTLWGMGAFVSGAVVCHLVLGRRRPRVARKAKQHAPFSQNTGWWMVATGFLSYFVLMPFSFSIPSLTAIVAAFATLLIAGFCLKLYTADLNRAHVDKIRVFGLLPLLPFATLVSGGFIGYGTYWVLSVIAFVFVFSRNRKWFYLSAPVIGFLGLSLFVAYMGERTGIRELIWHEHATLADRLDRTSEIVTNFKLLDINSPDDVRALLDRLNQNYLVGAAVTRHENGLSNFAYGGTVPLWSLVPRAVWPDKPLVGGGLDVVSKFTGIRFDENTSVGAGQVLEFYVNFGIPGVLIGFAVLGCLLRSLDGRIMRALAEKDMRGFLLCTMPGLTLLQPGGNLLEILIAVVAAVFAAFMLAHFRVFEFRTSTPNVRQPQILPQ